MKKNWFWMQIKFKISLNQEFDFTFNHLIDLFKFYMNLWKWNTQYGVLKYLYILNTLMTAHHGLYTPTVSHTGSMRGSHTLRRSLKYDAFNSTSAFMCSYNTN